MDSEQNCNCILVEHLIAGLCALSSMSYALGLPRKGSHLYGNGSFCLKCSVASCVRFFSLNKIMNNTILHSYTHTHSLSLSSSYSVSLSLFLSLSLSCISIYSPSHRQPPTRIFIKTFLKIFFRYSFPYLNLSLYLPIYRFFCAHTHTTHTHAYIYIYNVEKNIWQYFGNKYNLAAPQTEIYIPM